MITFNLITNKHKHHPSAYFEQHLHGDGDEQHVQALEDDVATVADPDVGAEDHCEESAALQG